MRGSEPITGASRGRGLKEAEAFNKSAAFVSPQSSALVRHGASAVIQARLFRTERATIAPGYV